VSRRFNQFLNQKPQKLKRNIYSRIGIIKSTRDVYIGCTLTLNQPIHSNHPKTGHNKNLRHFHFNNVLVSFLTIPISYITKSPFA